MSLQNRCDPAGMLHDHPARGLFTGNRGIIHDAATKALTGKRWTTKAWICCAPDWKGHTRDVWGRNHSKSDGSRSEGWTELFFCVEVTALAAGHRPCFTCRRAEAEMFAAAFAQGQGRTGISAPDMDEILHHQRRLSMQGEPQRLSMIDLPSLPDGTVVESGGRFYALRERRALAWDFSGYGAPQGLSDLMRATIMLVTPKATVAALRSGYMPVWARVP